MLDCLYLLHESGTGLPEDAVTADALYLWQPGEFFLGGSGAALYALVNSGREDLHGFRWLLRSWGGGL